jgi:YqjK-like protein
MSERMFELRQRRGELLARIEMQRGQLAEITSAWKGPLEVADQGVSVLQFLRGHPLLVAAIAAIVFARRRSVAGLLKTAWQMWSTFRSFSV